ncbi:hypothetical protein C7M61_002071 [Candidozyma pseudohaemuli]|uniref:NDT80 domain-containing protein n=1 Tax=Candidozyma pseudohaemuli TaxID=418784 RepID=A0A2P7YU22_9ASCO|nr:hypothetical protein C7M61_002071 [[Candida] pseudohaemulonii]PSK39457.1 hypothetical protein C7M61_002071 [[Candida] pseudohaemulonii]
MGGKVLQSSSMANLPTAKRAAPRSLTQFKIGPPFSPTSSVLPIYSLTGAEVEPVINARSDRGFDREDGDWIGYKRNYFALVASFHFHGQSVDICSTESFYTVDEEGEKHQISCFKLGLFDYCLDTGDTGKFLVQHTSKRDKGPQFLPPVYNIVPGLLPLHGFMKLIANIRNPNRIDKCYEQFYLTEKERNEVESSSALASYPENAEIARVARYERMQFLTVSKHFVLGCNRKFRLVIRLMCELENGETRLLATSETPCLNIRGRSPMNYVSEAPAEADKENDFGQKRRSTEMSPMEYSTATVPSKRSCLHAQDPSTWLHHLEGFKGRDQNHSHDHSGSIDRSSCRRKNQYQISDPNIDTALLSSPVESLTPRQGHIVTLKLPGSKLKDASFSSNHLQEHDPAKVTLNINGSPMTSMPSTPRETNSYGFRSSEIDPAFLQQDNAVNDAVEEYRKVQQELKILAPDQDFELDLPVPLTVLLTNGTSANSSFFRLPPASMGQPEQLCKHGCKMRTEEHEKLTNLQWMNLQAAELDLTSFFENNTDSSLMRFRSLLSRIKADIAPVTGELSPLSDFSNTYLGPLW